MSKRTCVQISFFKPTGYVDTWVVETEDRFKAFMSVIKKYPEKDLKFINFITHKMIIPEKFNLIKEEEL